MEQVGWFSTFLHVPATGKLFKLTLFNYLTGTRTHT